MELDSSSRNVSLIHVKHCIFITVQLLLVQNVIKKKLLGTISQGGYVLPSVYLNVFVLAVLCKIYPVNFSLDLLCGVG